MKLVLRVLTVLSFNWRQKRVSVARYTAMNLILSLLLLTKFDRHRYISLNSYIIKTTNRNSHNSRSLILLWYEQIAKFLSRHTANNLKLIIFPEYYQRQRHLLSTMSPPTHTLGVPPIPPNVVHFSGAYDVRGRRHAPVDRYSQAYGCS